jgi:uncharacterized protein
VGIVFEKQWLSPKSGFDLGGLDTYYTRPMSEPWSRPLDIDRLADGGAEVEFTIALSELALPAGASGSVGGRVRFKRQQGLAVAELSMRGEATLECQRCLRPLRVPIDAVVEVALVGSEADAARVPAELEPVLAPGSRISIGQLVTEELLLTLPIVPLHAGSESCAPAPAESAPPQRAEETHKPFARLAELLKTSE